MYCKNPWLYQLYGKYMCQIMGLFSANGAQFCDMNALFWLLTLQKRNGYFNLFMAISGSKYADFATKITTNRIKLTFCFYKVVLLQ